MLDKLLEVLHFTMAENVQKGADWLDEEVPEWHNRVVLDELMMDNPGSCICGQVFQDLLLQPMQDRLETLSRISYSSGYDAVQLTYGDEFAEEHGFNTLSTKSPEDGRYGWFTGMWDTLAHYWGQQIEKRRAGE